MKNGDTYFIYDGQNIVAEYDLAEDEYIAVYGYAVNRVSRFTSGLDGEIYLFNAHGDIDIYEENIMVYETLYNLFLNIRMNIYDIQNIKSLESTLLLIKEGEKEESDVLKVFLIKMTEELIYSLKKGNFKQAYDIVDAIHFLPEICGKHLIFDKKNYQKNYIRPLKKWKKFFYDPLVLDYFDSIS